MLACGTYSAAIQATADFQEEVREYRDNFPNVYGVQP
jgi:hypothetical protein